MRTTEIQAFKKIASKNFRLKDVDFVAFDKIEKTEAAQLTEGNKEEAASLMEIDIIDIWAELKIKYEGTPPDSYRVLNSMILDWVDSNEDSLKKILNPKLIPFLNSNYPDIDTSDLVEDFDDYIWEDQVDYHPQIDEKENLIYFTIELVLNIEEA